MRYFIGNWKMYGIPNSINIIKKINSFVNSDKNHNKYRTLIAPPLTLLETFNRNFKNKRIQIAAQNYYHKDLFSSNTGAVSAFMLKKIGVNISILGHSDNRTEGENNQLLRSKIKIAKKNNLKIIFCIGENLKDKKKGKTKKILKKQIVKVLDKTFDPKKLIVAYEPIWSIGTGMIPSSSELVKTVTYIKQVLKNMYKGKKIPAVLYGGSVDEKNINQLKNITTIDGFLIGGASRSSKKFIDIIKNYYR